MTDNPPDIDDDDEWPVRYVCHGCIGEKRLKAEIRRHGALHACEFCGSSHRRAVTTTWLATRIEPVLELLIGVADEELAIYGDHVTMEPNGDAPGALIAEIIEAADDVIADEIVEYLADK